MDRTQIYLPPEQHKALLKEAARRGISFAALMREIVTDHLEKDKKLKKPPKEVYLRLVGLGQSGARDVSEHHDRYLAEALKNDHHG
ncbi:MAG: CopG family transcriptional regulator [Bacillota bacterium]|nr:CopG family transcriptional regulator [Bacillota bacterium]